MKQVRLFILTSAMVCLMFSPMVSKSTPLSLLVKAIHAAGGIKKKAAKLLHISFRSMRYRVEKYNLGTVGDDELDDDN